jgi:hypothetical protein
LSYCSYTQSTDEYIVYFKNKDQNTYSLQHPEKYLSTRAIERRARFNIQYNLLDLPVSAAYIEAVLNTGVSLKYCSKWVNAAIIYNVSNQQLDALTALSCVSRVSLFKKNTNLRNLSKKEEILLQTPSDIMQLKSTNDFYDYGFAYNQIQMLSGEKIHNQGYRGEDMVITVLDAGFIGVDTMQVFKNLWDNGRILGSRDFVTNGGNVFASTAYSMHGMAVLSTMGGYLPGKIIGTAPEADYYLIRTEDPTRECLAEELYWICGAELADSIGTDIINSSLGYTTFDSIYENHSYSDMDGNTTLITRGADIAASKGILVVNSAGNSGDNAWYYIGAPADGDSVLTIGAVYPDSSYASFSSKGPTYDGRVKPEVVAMGGNAAVANLYGGISFSSGTSFSSPIIAGLSACLWQAHKNYSNMQIIKAIIQSASQVNNFDYNIGYGIPNFDTANRIIGINEYQNIADDNFIVFPNPFEDSFTIRSGNLSFVKTISVEISNIYGKLVFQKEYKDVLETPIKIQSLKSGIYVLTIISEGKKYPYKIIKVN